MGPLKPRKLADVLPISVPSLAELWARNQLALSVLDQRGAVQQILLGASLDELTRG